MPTTTNNIVRVHPAPPSYSVVVPAPELLRIDVAVDGKIGIFGGFCKGQSGNRDPGGGLLIADTPAPHTGRLGAVVGSQP